MGDDYYDYISGIRIQSENVYYKIFIKTLQNVYV